LGRRLWSAGGAGTVTEFLGPNVPRTCTWSSGWTHRRAARRPSMAGGTLARHAVAGDRCLPGGEIRPPGRKAVDHLLGLVAVEVLVCSVVAHGGVWADVSGCDLDVAEVDAGVEHGGDVGAPEQVWGAAAVAARLV
jgi:hypothetical protein